MDYLDNLLEKVEEVLSEDSILSLLQEGEMAGTPGYRKANTEQKNRAKEGALAQEDAQGDLEAEAWNEALDPARGSPAQGQTQMKGAASHQTQKDGESPLRASWDWGASGKREMAGGGALGEGRIRKEAPGAYLLKRMQTERRRADLGSGGGILRTTDHEQKVAGVSRPSPFDVAAFDRTVEREARGYDHGFLLL